MDTKKKSLSMFEHGRLRHSCMVSSENNNNNNNNFLNFGHGQDMMAKKNKGSAPETYTGLVIPDELGCFSGIFSSIGLAETPSLRASAISSPTLFSSRRP